MIGPCPGAILPTRNVSDEGARDGLVVGLVTVGARPRSLVVYPLALSLRRQAHETRLFLDYLTRWLESLKVEEKREDVVDAVPILPFPRGLIWSVASTS